MKVTKRNSNLEDVSFDKVLRRIKILSENLTDIDSTIVAQKVCSLIYNNVKTSDLDELAARICNMISTDIPNYGILASRIIISNNHKNTPDTFSECIEKLKEIEILDPKIYNFVCENKEILNSSIQHNKDYDFSWFSFKTLEKSYLLKVNNVTIERIQYMFMRVSCGIHYPDIEEVLKSYEGLSNKYFTHATPTLFNSGTNRPQLLSCFLTKPEDSISGIYKWISDLAKISKDAGGIGGTVSSIRGKGSYIKGSNSYSSGIIPMLKVVNETMKYVNQGGRRAGSAAIYLEPHHPDIMEFLEIRLNHGNEEDRARDLFTAIWASDLFMQRIENDENWSLFDPSICPGLDDVFGNEYKQLYEKFENQGLAKKVIKAQDVWKAITKSQIETGTPYIAFKDSINEKSNQKDYGVIKASNLCVSPETLILTEHGYIQIDKLENKYVNVWNGEQFSEALVKKTGENQKLIKIKLNNGAELDCTEYHKFYISKKFNNKNPKIVQAKDLKKGMKLWKCDFPVIKNGVNEFKYPYTHGYYCSDATFYCERYRDYYFYDYDREKYYTDCSINDINEKYPTILLFNEQKEILKHLNIKSELTFKDDFGIVNCFPYVDLPNRFEVPLNCNLSIKLQWLEGYIDGSGFVCKKIKNNTLHIRSINKSFLEKVRLLCQTMGIDPKITYDSSNEMEIYKYYRLLISSYDLYKLIQLGFSPKTIILNKDKPEKEEKNFVKVLSIKDEGRISDTYCFGEPLKNAGIFNGIYTGQCCEITEYHDENEYACCVLSSICLPMFLNEKTKEFDFKKLEEISGQMVRNLNKAIDVNLYPVPETKYSNMKHRPLGIGVQGLADVFCIMRYPFDSKEALELNENIFETIYYGSLKASLELAKKDGPYETFKGSPLSKGQFQFDLWNKKQSIRYDWDSLRNEVINNGVRNSLLVACMPTASTSQIMGNNETIEPFTSNMYVRRTLSGEFIVSNKYMINDLYNLGIWNKNMKDMIIANNGSIQNIDGIPENIKKLYKTSWELSQKCLIDLSISRGPYICQTQSLNLFFEEPTTRILTSAMFYAWKNGLKTGVYYVRSRPKTQAQQFTIDPKLIKNKVQKEYICTDDICYSCSG